MCDKKNVLCTVTVVGMMLLFNAAYAAETVYETVSADGQYIYAIDKSGVLMKYDVFNNMYSTKIADNVMEVSGEYLLKTDGTMFCFRDETVSFIADDVRDISAGDSYVLILKTDGTLWGMGSNSLGQLAQGELSVSVEEQKEGSAERAREHKINRTICVPKEFDTPVKILDGVLKARAVSTASIVLKTDGSVWTFGSDGRYGLLGRSSYDITDNAPRQIFENTDDIYTSGGAAVLRSSGSFYRWGTYHLNGLGTAPEDDEWTPARIDADMTSFANSWECDFVVRENGCLQIIGDEGDIYVNKFPLELPYTVTDNVNYVCHDTYYYTAENMLYECVVLKNDGRLYVLSYNSDWNGDPEKLCTFKAVDNNIRLTNENSNSITFVDVSDLSDYEKSAIYAMSSAGMMEGTDSDHFMPDKELTRAESAVVMLRMLGVSDEEAVPSFTDVGSNNWYYNVVGLCEKYGIMDGYDDNTFRGNDSVTDLQLAVLAARVLRNSGTARDVMPKETITNVPDWARDDVNYAYSQGLITVDDVATLSDTPITRAKAAVILNRLYNAM